MHKKRFTIVKLRAEQGSKRFTIEKMRMPHKQTVYYRQKPHRNLSAAEKGGIVHGAIALRRRLS